MKRIVLIAAAAVLAAEVFVPAVYAKEEESSSPGEKLETYHRNPAPESIPALLREIDAAALNQHAYPPSPASSSNSAAPIPTGWRGGSTSSEHSGILC